MALVQIIAGHRVEMYTTSYGTGPISSFEDREYYEVSDTALAIMLNRKWAKQVRLDEVQRQPIEYDDPKLAPNKKRRPRSEGHDD